MARYKQLVKYVNGYWIQLTKSLQQRKCLQILPKYFTCIVLCFNTLKTPRAVEGSPVEWVPCTPRHKSQMYDTKVWICN